MKRLYFWYDTYRDYPDDQAGMLRLFLHANPNMAKLGQRITLGYSLQILEQASAILNQQEPRGRR